MARLIRTSKSGVLLGTVAEGSGGREGVTPTYHLRGTPWPLSVTGPKFAVVELRETIVKRAFDVAWFFKESEAREYIRLMETKKRRKR